MKLTQLSIFIENRRGRLATVSDLLADAQINILASMLADTSDFGILRLIVSDIEKAEVILKSNGFTTARTSVVAIHAPNYAGCMSSILKFINEHHLNIEYMYAMSDPIHGGNALIFRCDDIDNSLPDLVANGFKLLNENDL